MRSFVALSLPQEVRRELEQSGAPFRSLGLDARFADPHSMHLTLKFLGDVDPRQINVLTAHISEAALLHASFRLTLGTLGVFPNLRRPRVLWRGLRGIAPLLDLQRSVSAALQEEGFQPEKRPYAPHFTLARLRSPRNSHVLREHLEQFNSGYEESQAQGFQVSEVQLYRSVLRPSGAEHKILASAPMKKSA